MSKIKPPATNVNVIDATSVSDASGLLSELRQLIEHSRRVAVAAVNASLTLDVLAHRFAHTR